MTQLEETMDQTVTEPEGGAEPSVEVRRNGRLAVVLAVLFAAVAVAFLVRGGGAVDWVLGGVLAVLALGWGWVALDARTPLLLADEHGIRIRLGRTWCGMPWDDLDEVEHLPRQGVLRDGRLALLPVSDDAATAVPTGARLQAAVARKLYGVPFALPLGLTTQVVGGSRDLTERLAWLAGERTTIVEIDPSLAEEDDVDVEDVPAAPAPEAVEAPADAEPESPADAEPQAPLAGRVAEPASEASAAPRIETTPELVGEQRDDARPEPTRKVARLIERIRREAHAPRREAPAPPDGPTGEAAAATDAPEPRQPVVGVRAEINRVSPARPVPTPVDGATALQPEHAPGVVPIAVAGEAVEPIVIEDPESEPAPDPVIGPQIAAARTRLGLSVDQLADRTRIRPHVIESIEVDDFAPCGGDFYARGHLRTLARVLGIESGPLLEAYDATYADAPLDPRAVFEAELATGSAGTIRRMRGGPNWSVLVAAVMAVVLLWSVAKLVVDGTDAPAPQVAGLANGSQGTTNPYASTAKPVPVELTAAGGGAHVVVRGGDGDVVFSGNLAFGQTKTLKVSPPLRVQTSDGSVEVAIDGGDAEAVGATGEQAQRTFTLR